MKWGDLIEQIIVQNNGLASIQLLYKSAGFLRQLPAGDWQKTLRGVLYREVNRGRFKKVGLGVYALSSYKIDKSAYSYVLQNKNIHEYLKNKKDYHSTIEGMLIELGNYFDYITYTGDLNKSFDGKKLSSICQINEVPGFTYPELKKSISKSDTIWFGKSRLLFPKAIFEVEATTDFTNSMLKMYQLLDFNTNLVLVAAQNKENMFIDRLTKEPFVKVKDKFSFRSFESVTKLYFTSVEHYELKSNFLALK